MIFDCFKKNLVLESPRMILRPLKKSDCEDILEIYSDADMLKYYNLRPFKTLEEAKGLTKFFMQGQKEKSLIRWGMELKESGKLIGTCGFHSFSEDDKKAEIGFDLARKEIGRGLMRETVIVLLNFIFTSTDINRIEAFTEAEDQKLQELLNKIGFTKEGEMRQYKLRRRNLTDMNLWSLLRKDFPM